MKTYEWPLSPQQLKELALAEFVTFDLFETLVCRTGKPTDPFKIYGVLGRYIRKYSELIMRVFQKSGWAKDFKLESLRFLFGEKIDQEFRYDLDHLLVRNSILDLLNTVLSKGTKIGIVTNSYYSNDQITAICKKLDLVGQFELIVSSEVGVTKRQGLLQKSQIPIGSPHWHFGDDLKEDAAVSDGIFVHIKKILDLIPAVNSGVFSLPKYDKRTRKLFAAYIQIATEYEEEINPWFWFGVFFSGPLSLSIAQNLNSIAEDTGVNYIYLLARDGYLPFRCLQAESNLQINYLPYSRKLSMTSANLQRLVSWIEKETAGQKKLFFDLGWQGKSAAKLANRFGENSSLILFGRWPWHKRIEKEVIYFGSIRTLIRAFHVRRCPELFELALSAPHDSLEELPSDLVGWSRLINFDSGGNRYEIARGSLEFLRTWDRQKMGEIPIAVAIKPLLTLIRHPRLEFLKLASFESHEYGGERVPLVGKGNSPITFWIKGSWKLQKSLQIPLGIRVRNAMKEWFRRLRFQYPIET